MLRPAKGPKLTLNTGCANHELAHRVFPQDLASRAKPVRNIVADIALIFRVYRWILWLSARESN
jgi:hypothetical protein